MMRTFFVKSLRLLQLLLPVLIAFAFMLAVPAIACNEEVSTVCSPNYKSSTSVISYPELENFISEGIKAFSDRIDISSFGLHQIDQDFLQACFSNVRHDHPEYFYLSNHYSLVSIGDDYVAVVPKYTMEQDKIDPIREKIEQECENVVGILRDDMTDVEKLLAIYDYFCIHYRYDEKHLESDPIHKDSYNLMGVMVNKMGVCQSYAFAYEFVLTRLGYECTTVTSDTMNHMWNLVKLDDKWYHVDVTWGDPTSDRCGNVSHKYFLISDETISDSQHGHYGWSASVQCTDKAYESAPWVNSRSAVAFDDDNMYISLPTGEINSVDRETLGVKTLYKVNERWNAPGGGAYVERYHKIGLLGEKIYFNLPDRIMSMAKDGSLVTTELETDSGASIFGMYIEDGVLNFGVDEDAEGYLPANQTLTLIHHFDIVLKQPQIDIGAGQCFDFSELIASGYSTGELEWSTSDGSVAVISNGKLVMKSVGNVKVKVSLADTPWIFAEIDINVSFAYGDADSDGEITVSDMVAVAQTIAGWNTGISDEAASLCDVDSSGNIDISDLVLLAQFVAGWNVELGLKAD